MQARRIADPDVQIQRPGAWPPDPMTPVLRTARGGKERAVVHALATAIVQDLPVTIYAQTRGRDFWYKVYFVIPDGILKSDTGGEHLERRRFASRVIQTENLTVVPLNALMQNWQRYGVWEISRPIGAALLRQWEAREARRSMAQAVRHADPMRGNARWN